ncbi:MAG: type II secretion system GspH family protein, partial [Armatimonadota bacterium]|nr:type II secretion system GspH family protein [Armatimonadota bacterium]
MKFSHPKKEAGFTLVEVMVVVLIIGILLNIATPGFISARESSRAKACIGNLKQIDSATQQYCMNKKLSAANYGTAGNTPTIDTNAGTGLVGTSGYIRAMPLCPSSGTYSVAPGISGIPTCTVVGDGSTNYTSGGRYYHG